MAEVRVGHCVHGLGLGGAQKVIECIARRRADGFRHFVYSSEGGVLHEEVAAAGAEVRIVPRRVPKFDPFWVAALTHWMRRDRISVVHTHLFGDSLHGYLAARRAGRLPVVMTLHIGPEGCSALQLHGYSWLIKRCSRVVACSGAVRDSFRAFLDGAGADIVAIPNGIEEPDLSAIDATEIASMRGQLGLDGADITLAAVGRMSEQKGYRYLIEALAMMPTEAAARTKLVFFGDGPDRRSLEQQAERLGVRERIVFAGFRPGVARWLLAIDVVVFSSLYEGLPIALLEAMACGRCIVTTDVPGIVEAVGRPDEALIVPREDPRQLGEALSRVATEPELRERLGAGARARFLADFTADAMVRRYQRLYRAEGATTAGPE